MSYELTSSVPIPKRSGHSGSAAVYPFAKMAVGDSFGVLVAVTSKKNLGTAAYCWAKYRKTHHPAEPLRRFTVRDDPQTPGAIRCWRMADVSPTPNQAGNPFRYDLQAMEVRPGEWVSGIYNPQKLIAESLGDTAEEAVANAKKIITALNQPPTT